MAGPASSGLVVRLVRWTLPAALLVATIVALLGLGGIVLSAPPEARPTPEVALNLTRAPALPVADDGAVLPPAPRPDCASPAGLPRGRSESGAADEALLPATLCPVSR